MRFSARLTFAYALLLVLFACSRTAEQPPAATPSQPPPAAEQTPAPQPEPAVPPPTVPEKLTKAAPAPAKAPAARPPVETKSVAANEPPARIEPPAPAANKVAPTPPPPPKPEIVTIPSGTLLTIAMIDSIGTDTNKAGDTFTGSISDPVVVDGKTVLPKGMKVKGRIETLDEPGRVKGKAAMSLVLTDLVGQKSYAITTDPFSAQAGAETKQNALKVGGGAAIGAIIGAIAGGKKGAATGAAVGGGAGTAAVLATRGQQLKIESEQKVNFVLRKDVDVELTKSSQ